MDYQPIERSYSPPLSMEDDPDKTPTQTPRVMPKLPDIEPLEEDIELLGRSMSDTHFTRLQNLLIRDLLCGIYGVPEGGEIPDYEGRDVPITPSGILARTTESVINVPVGPIMAGEPVPAVKFNLDSRYPFTGEHESEMLYWCRVMEALPGISSDVTAQYYTLGMPIRDCESGDERIYDIQVASRRMIARLHETLNLGQDGSEDGGEGEPSEATDVPTDEATTEATIEEIDEVTASEDEDAHKATDSPSEGPGLLAGLLNPPGMFLAALFVFQLLWIILEDIWVQLCI